MAMKTLKHDIRLMKWTRDKGCNWIFAKAWTFSGQLILLSRGYRKHYTLFGYVMRKDIKPPILD